MPCHTRVALSRRYLERACACRDQGDLKTACEMLDLALYFDPTSESALKLREKLCTLQDQHVPATKDIELSEELRLTPITTTNGQKAK